MVSETSKAESRHVSVYPATDFQVISGANEGDALSFADDLELDDTYILSPNAARRRLMISPMSEGCFALSQTSGEQRQLHLDSTLSFMATDGLVTELIVLVEIDDRNMAQQIYLLPLVPLEPQTEYRLVGIERKEVARKFAQAGCVSFARGTHITLASGQQVQVEKLQVGDRILTRDDGIQSLRWIGRSTQRASGSFAPVSIRAGTLNNTGDLIVSPEHRLFVYQRTDELGAGRAELLVKARHLVNGTTVTQQQGGFIDYFQLLFDRHQIIYAEGIAAESMLVDDRAATLVAPHLLKELSRAPHLQKELSELEVRKALVARPDAADLLKRASRG